MEVNAVRVDKNFERWKYWHQKRFSLNQLLLWVVSVFLIGVFLGYGWRMIQLSSNEVEAFYAGVNSGKRILINTVFNQKGIVHVYGLRVVPRDDGRVTLEKVAMEGR